MDKIDVKVVIGSNYGDEGKGLATHYFAQKAKKSLCLNVLYNGGCQRGHTVELKNGIRHIFHHFGAGTFDNAQNYFDKDFILNPTVFNSEYCTITRLGITPTVIISPDCMVSTPYDIFINQIVELHRGSNRHGSCGYGIWETKERYKKSSYNLTFGDLLVKTNDEIMDYLKGIAFEYVPKRLAQYGIYEIPQEYQELIQSYGLVRHYLSDLRDMQRLSAVATFDRIKHWYRTIIFEGAQGLALDADNISAYPNVTASNTTSLVPMNRISGLNCNIEICYVTRAYFTRHGAGKFPTECEKNLISDEIVDNTNIYNDFQQDIRYGLFDMSEFMQRVETDIGASKKVVPDLTTSLMVTHLNYSNDIAGNCTFAELGQYFDNTYLSYSKFAEDIKENI